MSFSRAPTGIVEWMKDMKVVETNSLEEAEELANPGPQLYAVTGDKQPPGYNWLSGLKEGTIFFCRPFHQKGKPKNPFLEEYHVVRQFGNCTKLLTNLNQDMWFVVDPVVFCGIMEKVHQIEDMVDE